MRKSLVNVTVEKVGRAGSCNFCNRGTYNKGERNLAYPYNAVFVLKGSQISSNICYECSKVLRESLDVMEKQLLKRMDTILEELAVEDMENMEDNLKGDE